MPADLNSGYARCNGQLKLWALILSCFLMASMAIASGGHDDHEPPPAACEEGPTSTTLLGNRVLFLGAFYDDESETTEFKYKVSNPGVVPPMNKFTVGVFGLRKIVSVKPEPGSHIGFSETTGIRGVTFNPAIPPHQSRIYCITLHGRVPVGTVPIGGKADGHVETDHLAGPNIFCEPGPPPSPTPTPEPPFCEPGPGFAFLDGFLVKFGGAEYDEHEDTTKFTYEVMGRSRHKELKSFKLGIDRCPDPIMVMPHEGAEIVEDTHTGKKFIKWSIPLEHDESRLYMVKFAGQIGVGTVRTNVDVDRDFDHHSSDDHRTDDEGDDHGDDEGDDEGDDHGDDEGDDHGDDDGDDHGDDEGDDHGDDEGDDDGDHDDRFDFARIAGPDCGCVPVEPCEPGPDSVLLRGFLVEFIGADYDEIEDTTKFTYEVSGHDARHDLSFFVLEILGECPEPLAIMPHEGVEIGRDPHTGIRGIKWDIPLHVDESRTYMITFAGRVEVGTVRTGVKAAVPVDVGFIAGPNCDCPPPMPMEPVPPIIGDIGDIIIGDLELDEHHEATETNNFVFPDAIDLDKFVEDPKTPDSEIKWSFTGGMGRILINGVEPLDLGSDDPTSPTQESRIDLNDEDPAAIDDDPFTITFRNAELSPIGGPNLDPGVEGIVTTQTATLTLFASNCATFGQRTIVVYTANNASDSISGSGGMMPMMSVAFTGGAPDHWVGGIAFGEGSAFAEAGLCLTVPMGGDNHALWITPENFVELVDNAVYQIRANVSTDQSAPDAVPLWMLEYDNFQSSGFGNNYGGSAWFLDVDGGASGIGRARTQFDLYANPIGIATPQWRGAVDGANSAFSPAAEPVNDMRVLFRVLDLDSGPLNAQSDFGTICLESIEISTTNLADLEGAPVYNPPINSATHFAQRLDQTGGGVALIDDGTATAFYSLAIPDDRKTLGPFDSTQADLNSQLYPVAWNADALYRGNLTLRSGSAGGTDPVDAIALAFDTATNELGAINWTTRGAPGNMEFAGSPRADSSTYTSFFHGQGGTNSLVPNANRLRFMGEFFNTGVHFGAATGTDPLIVEGLAVEEVTP